MFLIKSVFFLCLLFCVSTQKKDKTDAIGFPESEENPDLKNKENRIPVFIPAMCPVNELYYPGDQKDDWICDCRPAFIYHPTSDACWPAYRKGPCAQGEYLVLKQDSDIPVCEKNPCVVDGFVSWNTNCEKLGSTEPCKFMDPIPATLGVNATTLVVSCVRLTVPSRFNENSSVGDVCIPAGRRSINGKCVLK